MNYIELGQKYHNIALNIDIHLGLTRAYEDKKEKEINDIYKSTSLCDYQKKNLLAGLNDKYRKMRKNLREKRLTDGFEEIKDNFKNEIIELCPLKNKSAEIIFNTAEESVQSHDYEDDSFPLYLQHIAEEFDMFVNLISNVQNEESSDNDVF